MLSQRMKRAISSRKKRRKDRVFNEMYNAHYPVLDGLAMKLTSQNRALANDILQDCMVKAYRALDRFNGEKPLAWLKKILCNTYFDRYKKLKRERQLFTSTELDDVTRIHAAPEDEEFDVDSFDELLRALSDQPTTDAWANPIAQVMGDEVLKALHEMSPQYRAALLLQHVVGLSYEEISDTMDCKIGTVMSRLSRARDALKASLMQQKGTISKRLLSVQRRSEKFTSKSAKKSKSQEVKRDVMIQTQMSDDASLNPDIRAGFDLSDAHPQIKSNLRATI